MRDNSMEVALVTGAASGIGLACARRFAQDGYQVAMLDIDAAAVGAAASGVAGAIPIAIDLGDSQAVQRLPQRLDDLLGRAAVLINNAAISPKRAGRRIPTAELSLDDWELTLRVNLTAPLLLSQMVLAPMRRRRWGRIVNISSMAGRSPSGLAGLPYVTTKTGLLGMTRALAQEVAREGITVNSIAPGRFATPMGQNLDAASIARIGESIPVGRWGEPHEVADLAAFLAGEQACYITGAVLDINGGLLMV